MDTSVVLSETFGERAQLKVVVSQNYVILLLLCGDVGAEALLVDQLGTVGHGEELGHLTRLAGIQVKLAFAHIDEVHGLVGVGPARWVCDEHAEAVFRGLPLCVQLMADSVDEALDVRLNLLLLANATHSRLLLHHVRLLLHHVRLLLQHARLLLHHARLLHSCHLILHSRHVDH